MCNFIVLTHIICLLVIIIKFDLLDIELKAVNNIKTDYLLNKKYKFN